ncbi:hypothetical protein M011DRAFT_472074 [Sporormia fimetaria CBS 119925]|uniref:Uncharacterized protein n=1 Tax=Sporormia fimetaria CBS 119925 TaxID=1340428 RepID=A0A6A6UWT6_9PLEO|nr:hypothetical protein M011DRAFT_472074 [Sporormia fimetaria CBS 119925]
MLRHQVLRRNFSLWNRSRALPSRVIRAAARDGHGTVQVQRVHFRRRFFTRSRLYGFAFFTTTAYWGLRWIDNRLDDLEEIEEEEEGEWEEVGAQEDGAEEDEDEPEPILFIPTGLSRLKPRERMETTDPEYQTFAKIIDNESESLRIRGKMVLETRHIISKNAKYKNHLGAVDARRGVWWAAFHVPLKPAECERPGIELREDGSLHRSTRPVELIHHRILSTLFNPVHVAVALYRQGHKSATEWAAPRNAKGEAEKVSTAASSGPLSSRSASSHVPMQDTPDSSIARSTASRSTAPEAPSNASTPPTSPNPQDASTSPSPAKPSKWYIPVVSTKSLVLDLSTFWQTLTPFLFHHKVARGLDRLDSTPGTLLVVANVEVVGEKGYLHVTSRGLYDIAKKKYIYVKVDLLP